jgi:hypothetical protein
LNYCCAAQRWLTAWCRSGFPTVGQILTTGIVTVNESGGSVGIDNNAVKETLEAAQKQVDRLISTYHVVRPNVLFPHRLEMRAFFI